MPLTNGLKKSLAKGESTQSGISRWAAVLGLILSMTACTSLTAAGNRLPGQLVVGLNPQAHSGTFDAAGQAFVKELGAHSIRVGYKHGDHNFGVNWAAKNGVGVLFFLGYSQGCSPTTASGRQCYADRSANLAKTYGNKVQYYEVWNEWNGGIGLGCKFTKPPCNDAVMYTDLLCRTYRAVKAVQPNAKIVGGVTAGVHISFTSNMLDAGARNCMDVLSVHPYVYFNNAFTIPYNSSGTVGANRFVQAITAVDTLVRQKTGSSMPILVSEEGRTNAVNLASEQITADYLSEVYKRARSIPFLKGIWWFDLEDSIEGTYGLLRSNNTKKPGFAAFQAAAKK